MIHTGPYAFSSFHNHSTVLPTLQAGRASDIFQFRGEWLNFYSFTQIPLEDKVHYTEEFAEICP